MKKGFTLAEVLITLGIIGVVAAMTLPTLIQNYKKQVYANGAKKGLNTITNLMSKIQADEGVSDFTATSLFSEGVCAITYANNRGQIDFSANNGCEELYGNPTAIEKIIPKYIKTVKICKGTDCKEIAEHTDFEYGLLPHIQKNWSTKIMGVYSTDGMIYYVFPTEAGLSFIYDINGEKGPNESGRDLFAVSYCRSGEIGYSDYLTSCYSNDSYLYRLISNGWKMDY